MPDDESFLFLCERVWGLSLERKLLSAQARLTDGQGEVEDLADQIDLNQVDRRLLMARILETAQPEPPNPGSAPVQTASTLTPPPAAPSRLVLKSGLAVVSGRWLAPWTVRLLPPSIGADCEGQITRLFGSASAQIKVRESIAG